MVEKKSNKLKEFISTYKVPLVVFPCLYLGLLFIFDRCIIENDFHIISHNGDKLVIEVVKK